VSTDAVQLVDSSKSQHFLSFSAFMVFYSVCDFVVY